MFDSIPADERRRQPYGSLPFLQNLSPRTLRCGGGALQQLTFGTERTTGPRNQVVQRHLRPCALSLRGILQMERAKSGQPPHLTPRRIFRVHGGREIPLLDNHECTK